MMERLRSLMLVALLLALFNDGTEAVLSNFSAFNKEVAAIASHPVTDDDHKVLEAAVTVGPAGYTRDASLASGEFSDSSDMLGVVLNADGSVQDGQPAFGRLQAVYEHDAQTGGKRLQNLSSPTRVLMWPPLPLW